jgi:nucleoside-diphosphate-sugar epimerase
MDSKAKYLVTGASGFIGGWLVETLFLQGTVAIKAGIRNWSSAARLGRFPLNIVLCNILDEAQIANAIRDVDIVIHCASGSEEGIVQGTRNMLDAAYRSGVKRFIHLSSAEIYGDESGTIDESFPYLESGSPYGKAKIEAEKTCWSFFRKGLPLTIIRPSIVYGPFSKDWTIRLAERLQSGDWGVFQGIGDGICNLIYISDLVSGIVLAVHKKEAAGEAFNLVGPDLMTWNQYFQKFNAALGLPEINSIPRQKARLRAGLMRPFRSSAKLAKAHFEIPLKKFAQKYRPAKGLMKSIETKLKLAASPVEFSLYMRNATYISTKAKELLGFQPKFDIDTGLKLTAAWLELNGLTKR